MSVFKQYCDARRLAGSVRVWHERANVYHGDEVADPRASVHVNDLFASAHLGHVLRRALHPALALDPGIDRLVRDRDADSVPPCLHSSVHELPLVSPSFATGHWIIRPPWEDEPDSLVHIHAASVDRWTPMGFGVWDHRRRLSAGQRCAAGGARYQIWQLLFDEKCAHRKVKQGRVHKKSTSRPHRRGCGLDATRSETKGRYRPYRSFDFGFPVWFLLSV